MADVFDVAQFILARRGAMSTMKLQKLVYYSQAWAVVWDDDVLFGEQIEAWRNGPVVRELWEETKGQFRVARLSRGCAENITQDQADTIDTVLEAYGDHDAQWLSDLTHMEAPWQEAYAQCQNTEITPQALSEYYSSLAANDELLTGTHVDEAPVPA